MNLITIRSILLIALLGSLLSFGASSYAQNTVEAKVGAKENCPYLYISWNMENFGAKKSAETLTRMAQILKEADIVAIQEVNAGKELGAQALGRLVNELTAKGQEFDYVVSDPTLPHNTETERYAYLIRKSTFTFSRRDAHLVTELQEVISREPYTVLVAPKKNGSPVQIFTMHSVPTTKDPKREVRELVASSFVKNSTRAIFSGDFNLGVTATDPTFISMGYTANIRQKTSLKRTLGKNNEYLSFQYDNIYTKGVNVCESGVIDFVAEYYLPLSKQTLQDARKVSDHLPVYIRFK